MANGNGIILNGEKGAALVVYNVLASTSGLISGREIAHLTTYNPHTVYRAIKTLEGDGLIARSRQKNGQRYTYRIIE